MLQSYVSHFYAVLMTGDILQRIMTIAILNEYLPRHP